MHRTGIYVALLALLIVVLAFRVVQARRSRQVGIGDGGDKDLLRRIRAHANAVENIPIALLAILLLDLDNADGAWIHGLGITLVVGRLLHAWGLSRYAGTSFGRLVGTALTWLVIIVASVLLLYRYWLASTL